MYDAAVEEEKKETELDRLARTRAGLISIATTIAMRIVQEKGEVTSPMVLDEMREQRVPGLDEADPRFMGAVFRKGGSWTRVRFDIGGSHNRPMAVWRLKGESLV